MKIIDFFRETKEGLVISFQSIRANKMRSALTMLGIIIGIVSVTLMGTAIQGLSQAFNDNMEKIGTNVLYIQKFKWFSDEDWWKIRNRKDLTMEHFKIIERQATLVKEITPMTFNRISMKNGSRTVENIIVIGANEKYGEVLNAYTETGRFFTQPESDGGRPVVVLGSEIAENLFPNEYPIDKNVKIGTSTFRVIGVLEKKGSFLGQNLDDRVVIPINSFFGKFGTPRFGIQIYAKVLETKYMDDAKEEIRGILRKARNVKPDEEDDFGINQQEQVIETFNQIGGVVGGIGLFITALSLFVGAIGVMNIMFVSVTERTKEIGIRKAIGAKRSTILFQFLVEAATLS